MLKSRHPLSNEGCQFRKKTHASLKALADKKTPRGPIAFTETLGLDSPGTQSESSGTGTVEVPCCELSECGVVHLGHRKAKSPLQGVVNPVCAVASWKLNLRLGAVVNRTLGSTPPPSTDEVRVERPQRPRVV